MRVDQPRPCAYADQYSASAIGIASGAVSEGKSSHRLLSEHKVLRKRYWGQRQLASGYWVVLSGNVTDEVWKE